MQDKGSFLFTVTLLYEKPPLSYFLLAIYSNKENRVLIFSAIVLR